MLLCNTHELLCSLIVMELTGRDEVSIPNRSRYVFGYRGIYSSV